MVSLWGCQMEKQIRRPSQEELFEKMRRNFLPEAQTFQVYPGTDTNLTGLQGTEIAISKETFATLSEREPITIELEEYFDIGTMLMANLSTTSKGTPLETGGMVGIAISQNNMELKEPFEIKISIPILIENSDMNYYYGLTDSIDIQWQMASNPDSGSEESLDLSEVPIDSTGGDLLNYIQMGEYRWFNKDLPLEFSKIGSFSALVDNSNSDAILYIVLEDYNTIFPAVIARNKKVEFSNVPVGEKAVIVGLWFDEEEQISYLLEDITINESEIELSEFIASDKQEIQEILKQKFNRSIAIRK